MKFIAFIVVLVLNFCFSGLTQAKTYPDVSYGYKHYEAITAMTKRKVITGYPDGLFRPEDHINRAEATKVLIGSQFESYIIDHALDENWAAKHTYSVFPDVKIEYWYAKYIKVAHQNGIIQGYPDGLFRGDNFINFAEALKIILESHNVDVSRTPFVQTDLLHVKKGEWFEPYFSYARAHNLINPDKFYHPGQLIPRGELVEIIHRLQNIQKYELASYESGKTPTSNEYTITIPKLNIINLNVVFANIYNVNDAIETLRVGLGHFLARPGEGRTSIVYGHSSNYPWIRTNFDEILAKINLLKIGDKIYINYKEKAYIYEVYKTEIIPASQDYKMLENTHENKLILFTCWIPGSISHRYLVYAKPIF